MPSCATQPRHTPHHTRTVKLKFYEPTSLVVEAETEKKSFGEYYAKRKPAFLRNVGNGYAASNSHV